MGGNKAIKDLNKVEALHKTGAVAAVLHGGSNTCKEGFGFRVAFRLSENFCRLWRGEVVDLRFVKNTIRSKHAKLLFPLVHFLGNAL